MNELVALSASDYEELAFQLATKPERLGYVRAKLAELIKTSPLFDCVTYTRNIEALYLQIFRENLNKSETG
jgi:predicted O-linked N-acetylglucosamine transferase (SPINDLY family)